MKARHGARRNRSIAGRPGGLVGSAAVSKRTHDVARAAAALQRGELVGLPTETVYGLAGNALDPDVVVRIFEAKRRPRFDPLIVHLAGVEGVEAVVEGGIPEAARALVAEAWPGPLTLVLPRSPSVPDLVTAGLDTVAVRVPGHPLARQLLAAVPFPLAAPSANPFGYVSPTRAEHVLEQLGEAVACVLDGGPCTVGVESTIVRFGAGTPTVLRLGGFPLEDVRRLVGDVDVQTSSSNPRAPGQLQSHYAPRTAVLLDRDGVGVGGALRLRALRPDLPAEAQRVLAPDGDLRQAAQGLFAALRELDGLGLDWIAAELVPEEGLGRAINDRLRRAAR